MGPVGEPRGDARDWLRRQAAWLDASRAETVGLAILLAGAVAASVALWWTATPRVTPDIPAGSVAIAPAPIEPLHVHVSGEVVRPGVIRLPPGARVADALRAVGGPGPWAHLDGLNLARELNDGEQVVVPSTADLTVPSASGPAESNTADAGSGAWGADGRLDINRATAADLEELPGIGPVLAARIVAHREDHGPFGEVGDLRAVSGIGERTFQSLVDLITT